MMIGDLVAFCDADLKVDIVKPVGFKNPDPQQRLFERNQKSVGYNDSGIIVSELTFDDSEEKMYKVMMKGCSLWFFDCHLKKL